MFLASKFGERRQEIFGVMEGGKAILYRNGMFEEQAKTGCDQVWNTQHQEAQLCTAWGFLQKKTMDSCLLGNRRGGNGATRTKNNQIQRMNPGHAHQILNKPEIIRA